MLRCSKVVLSHPLASLGLRVGGHIALADLQLQRFKVSMGLQELLEFLS